MNGWRSLVLSPTEALVYPIGDVIDHEPVNCTCGPRTEPVKRDDGSMGWISVHHSLDGREKWEQSA